MLGLNVIHPMDCIEGMGKMERQSVDIVVTSPPYNIGKKYSGYNDVRPRDQYLDWLERVAEKCGDVLKEDASFFLNVGGKPSDPWIPIDVANRFRRHFVLQNTIHWVKSIAILKEDVGDYENIKGDIAVGHYQPVNSTRFFSGCHEYIFHFTRHGNVKLDKFSIGVKYQDKSNIGRWKSDKGDLRDRGNTWFIPYETVQESRPHPAEFPVKLPEMCIRLHGFDRETLVMDPFMGTGNTAVACRNLGVDFIGFEIDASYVDVATRKLRSGDV